MRILVLLAMASPMTTTTTDASQRMVSGADRM